MRNAVPNVLLRAAPSIAAGERDAAPLEVSGLLHSAERFQTSASLAAPRKPQGRGGRSTGAWRA
jgi:hypothetical protein